MDRNNTPDDEPIQPDSFTALLDATRPTFKGMATANGTRTPRIQDGDSDDEPPADEETDDVQTSVPPADTGEPSGETPPADEEPPALLSGKYKTEEERDKAFKEAEARMHAAAQEAADWRKQAQEAATLKQQLDQLQQDLLALQAATEHGKPPQTEPPAQEPFDVKTHLKTAYQHANEIELDPTAADYDQQLARQQDIIVEAMAAALERVRQDVPTTAQARAEAEAAAKRVLEEQTRQRTAEDEDARVFSLLLTTATEAGLDVESPSQANKGFGGLHYRDLVTAAQTEGIFPHEAPVEEQIAAVVDFVSKRHGITASAKPSTPAPPVTPSGVRRAQAHNTPMERSGMGRVATPARTTDETPMSLNDALSATMRSRQI